ncbi:MAG: hypothetical protein OXU78_05305 [Deltaproteobacteria bacterium]|nr:hypothetical protein [Deltaproteobacteria bacterium]
MSAPHTPAESQAGEVQAALARLRAAGAALRQRPAGDVLPVLCAVLDSWRAEDSPWRKQLEAALPRAAGFSPQTVRAGLALALDSWSGAALRALWERELGGGAGRSAHGFGATAVLLAGALPTPSLLQLIAPLLLRSPVLARPAAHDPVTPRALADSLRAADAELAACLEVVDFSRGDSTALAAFASADCVVATGADETVAAVAKLAAPPRRFVGYGHRFSAAVVGAEADVQQAARGLAVDISLWDQLGCLSPLAVWALCDIRALAEALAAELQNAAQRWPRGNLNTAEAAAIAAAQAEAEMRAAAGEKLHLHGGAQEGFVLVQETGARFRGSPLHRFVRLHPARNLEEAAAAIAPLAAHLSAVGLAGFGAETEAAAARLLQLGASRVCRPGRMQAPPLHWCHDGRGVLAPLARFGDSELGDSELR